MTAGPAGWGVNVPGDWMLLPTTPPPAGAGPAADALWQVASALPRDGVVFTVFGAVEPAPGVRLGGAVTVGVTEAPAPNGAGARRIVLEGLGPATRTVREATDATGTPTVTVRYDTDRHVPDGHHVVVSCALIGDDAAEWTPCADALASAITSPTGAEAGRSSRAS